MLVAGHVALTGDVDALLASHHRLVGPRRDPAGLPVSQTVIEASHTDRQTSMLIRTDQPIANPRWAVTPVTVDDLVLAYMRQARDAAAPVSRGLAVTG